MGVRAPYEVVPDPSTLEDFEVWENQTRSTFYVRKRSERGMMVAMPVFGGKRFDITPKDRRINEERCASPAQNPFRNGTLAPISLLDAERDTATLKANPNILSPAARLALFRCKPADFQKRIKQITNPTLLQALLTIAEDADATVRQVNFITGHLDHLTESPVPITIEDVTPRTAPRERKPRAVTPR